MSLLDRIRACNNADLSLYRPLTLAGQRIGWLGPAALDVLAGRDDLPFLTDQGGGLAIHPGRSDELSRAMEPVVDALEAAGLTSARRGELYAVRRRWADAPLFAIERAATPALGLRAWGVHLVGYIPPAREGGVYRFWIGTRSLAKPTYPGQLDNMVAGGQPAGLGFRQNLIKECAEEAGIPEALAMRARPAGMLSYVHEDVPGRGVKPDQLMVYDLALPEDFVPICQDGEIARFDLMEEGEVLALIRDTDRFKFNCSTVLIDFFLRHGLLDPDREPDYAALAAGLRVAD